VLWGRGISTESGKEFSITKIALKIDIGYLSFI